MLMLKEIINKQTNKHMYSVMYCTVYSTLEGLRVFCPFLKLLLSGFGGTLILMVAFGLHTEGRYRNRNIIQINQDKFNYKHDANIIQTRRYGGGLQPSILALAEVLWALWKLFSIFYMMQEMQKKTKTKILHLRK